MESRSEGRAGRVGGLNHSLLVSGHVKKNDRVKRISQTFDSDYECVRSMNE